MKKSVENFIDNHIEIIKDRGVLVYPEDVIKAKEYINDIYKQGHMGKKEIIKELNKYFNCETYGMSYLDYELTGKEDFSFEPNNESYDFNEDDE